MELPGKDSLLIKASDIPILITKSKRSGPNRDGSHKFEHINNFLLGDCLMAALLSKQKFSKERFKIYHPGGNIGKTLLLVKDVMLTGNKIPLINYNNNIVSAVQIINKKRFRDRNYC